MIRETTTQLLQLLTRWDRRLRLQQSTVWLPRGLMAGLGLGIGLAVASRIRPWLMPEQVLTGTGIAAAVGVLLVAAVIWLSQRDALTSARRFDSLFGLKERVSTSLELASGRIKAHNDDLLARQLEDSLTRARQVNPRAYLPLRLVRRDWGILVVLALALAMLLLLENPQNAALAQQQAIQTAIEGEVEALEDLRDNIENNPDLSENLRREMLEALNESIEQLSQENLSQEEAVAALADLEERLNDLAAGEQPTPADKQAFEEASRQLGEQAQSVAQAFEQSDLEQAAEALETLGQQLSNMDQAAQQDLAEALQNASDALAETSPELSDSLEQAAEALEQGDTQAAQDAMQDAADQLSQQAQEVTRSENSAGRQILTQASRQANASAEQIAQSGGGTARTGEASAAPEGDTPDSSGQEGEGAQNQTGLAGQTGRGEEGQLAGEGMGAAGQSGEASQQQEGGTAGGAGDGTAEGQEGGFAASGQQIGQGNAPDGTGLTDYEPVFSPQSIGSETGTDMQITGSGQPGDVVTREGELTEGPEGESLVGYDEVFSDYSNAANEALQRDYIPLGLRDVVHDYFSSLEPKRTE